MKTIAVITNKYLYEKVVDVDTSCLSGLNGTLGIELEGEEPKIITGEHGIHDYEKEYGFVLKVEV
jgi:hypothetical protein